jgi:hypothetical protein
MPSTPPPRLALLVRDGSHHLAITAISEFHEVGGRRLARLEARKTHDVGALRRAVAVLESPEPSRRSTSVGHVPTIHRHDDRAAG